MCVIIIYAVVIVSVQVIVYNVFNTYKVMDLRIYYAN